MKTPLSIVVAIIISTTTLLAQIPPFISYGTNLTFTVGSSITPVTPINAGGLVPTTHIPYMTTLAGSGLTGKNDGVGTEATFNWLMGIAIDSAGTLYVSDRMNHLIRKVSSTGIVSTLAGSGEQGNQNGKGAYASFNLPTGIAVDRKGAVYVADQSNHLVRKISVDGVVSTLAGSGVPGNEDGMGTSANFEYPSGIAVDDSFNVFVTSNKKIRKILPSGAVVTFAGSGAQANVDGVGTEASFYNAFYLTRDRYGNLYVSDAVKCLIRKITPAGVVTTLAGSGQAGYVNSKGLDASFQIPYGMAVDSRCNVYVADKVNNVIRMIDSTGVVTTFSGSGAYGGINGYRTNCSFHNPNDLTVDAAGNIYVADGTGQIIRKITQYGYSICPQLPSGLNFDQKTGIISGNPKVVSPSTNYTVTAVNSWGISSTTINVSVSSASSLPSATMNVNVSSSANRQITIQSTEAFNNASVLSIYNMMGQIVWTKKPAGENALVSDPLTAGIYLVHLKSTNNELVRKVLVK